MLTQVIAFLLDAVVGFFATLFLLRFLMQWLRVSFAGPLGHFVVQLTNWGVQPLRRVVPGFAGLDWSSLLAALALECLLAGVLIGMSGHGLAGDSTVLFALFGLALRNLMRLIIYIFIAALILQAVLSWVSPYSPLSGPANQMTRRLLDPIRRVVPPIGGIDLSPLVAVLLLQLLLMFF